MSSLRRACHHQPPPVAFKARPAARVAPGAERRRTRALRMPDNDAGSCCGPLASQRPAPGAGDGHRHLHLLAVDSCRRPRSVRRRQDLTTAVVAAGLADRVRTDHRAAVRAGHELGTGEGKVRAAVALAGAAELSLRIGHGRCSGVGAGATKGDRPVFRAGRLRTARTKSTPQRRCGAASAASGAQTGCREGLSRRCGRGLDLADVLALALRRFGSTTTAAAEQRRQRLDEVAGLHA